MELKILDEILKYLLTTEHDTFAFNELPRGRASRYRVTRKLTVAGFC